MIISLLVNSIEPGSYPNKKTGELIPTLDLICFDRGEGRRIGHSIKVGVDRSQKEKLLNADLRDKVISLDVSEVRLDYKGGVQFVGLITNVDELTGPLKVEKPAKA